ncbi:MAG: hypothetical protein GY856_05400, partial [bacterium]|nr:hypothetical protein [bacterium]
AERLSGEPGEYSVRLHFSGEEIYRSHTNGPYLFRASISSERGVADTLSVKTPPYPHIVFGEESSEILTVETKGIDVDGDGLYEVMEATVGLNVRRPGLFVLEARLAQQGQTIAEVARRVPLLPGKRPRTVKLGFPGKLIARKGLKGPYELTVHHLGEDFSSIGSKLVTVTDFTAAEFE